MLDKIKTKSRREKTNTKKIARESFNERKKTFH